MMQLRLTLRKRRGTIDLYACATAPAPWPVPRSDTRRIRTLIRSNTWPGKRTEDPCPQARGLCAHTQGAPFARIGDALCTFPGMRPRVLSPAHIHVPMAVRRPHIQQATLITEECPRCVRRLRDTARKRALRPSGEEKGAPHVRFCRFPSGRPRLAQRYRSHERQRKERAEFQRLCAACGVRPSWRDFLRAQAQTRCTAYEYSLFRFYERPAALRETS